MVKVKREISDMYAILLEMWQHQTRKLHLLGHWAGTAANKKGNCAL